MVLPWLLCVLEAGHGADRAFRSCLVRGGETCATERSKGLFEADGVVGVRTDRPRPSGAHNRDCLECLLCA